MADPLRRRAVIELSPTTLGLLEDCPACFWRHYHGLRRPDGPMPTITTGLDRVIKAYCDQYRPALPPWFEGRIEGTLLTPRPGRLTWQDAGRVVVVGIPDDVLLRPDGTAVPLDHKTRGSPPKEVHPAHALQLSAYALLLDAVGHRVGDRGILCYYIPQPGALHHGIPFAVEVREVPLDPGRVRTLAREGAALLEAPCPSPGPACAYCAYLAKGQAVREKGEVRGEK